jgi:hypothetical protein
LILSFMIADIGMMKKIVGWMRNEIPPIGK